MNQSRSGLLPGVLLDPIEEKTKEIFLSYDFEKSTDENIRTLIENFDKPELQSAIDYIKTTYKDSHQLLVQKVNKYRNKPHLAGDIKSFLNGILPLKCENCEDTYCHTTTENTNENATKCLICKRFSHKQCYADKPVNSPGIYFICTICCDSIESRKQKAATENKDENVMEQLNLNQSRGMSVSSLDPEEDGIPPPAQGTPQSTKSHDEKIIEDVRRESENQICPLYLESKCPHGLRGRNCNYEHPRRCRKYCSYGTEYKVGCRRGKNCWYWHPKLCQNSLRLQVCLNLSCKDIHLKGTQRKPASRENTQQRMRETEPEKRPMPWSINSQTNTNPQLEQFQNTRPTDQNDFLQMQLEKMKAELLSTLKEALHPNQTPQQTQIIQQPQSYNQVVRGRY